MSSKRVLTADEKADIIRRVNLEQREEDPNARPSVFVRDETDDDGQPIVHVRNFSFREAPHA